MCDGIDLVERYGGFDTDWGLRTMQDDPDSIRGTEKCY